VIGAAGPARGGSDGSRWVGGTSGRPRNRREAALLVSCRHYCGAWRVRACRGVVTAALEAACVRRIQLLLASWRRHGGDTRRKIGVTRGVPGRFCRGSTLFPSGRPRHRYRAAGRVWRGGYQNWKLARLLERSFLDFFKFYRYNRI
jgi:hypothetical protein